MAKGLGKTFVEIELDARGFNRGQKKLYKAATEGSKKIEDNFRSLRIKSDLEFDLMRKKAELAFKRISASNKATTNDRVRAEQAMSAQLKRIHEQQFGHQTSLMNKMKQNWMGLAAFVTATAVAAGKAFDMMEASAQAQEQKKSFDNLTASYGANSNKILSELKRVSDGTISTQKLIESAGTAMMLGINPDKISKMMEIARGTSKMTGQTVEAAFNDIAKGIGRQSKMILDNLGILVDVGKANKDYAKELNKTANELTDAEKKQAFMNATMRAGDDLLQKLGKQQDTNLDRIQKLTAGWSDFKIVLGDVLWKIFDVGTLIISTMSEYINKIIAAQFTYVSMVFGAIAKLWSVTGNWIIDQVAKLFKKISEQADKFGPWGKRLSKALGDAPEMMRGALDGATGLMDTLSEKAGDLAGHFEGAAAVAHEMADTAWKRLTDGEKSPSILNPEKVKDEIKEIDAELDAWFSEIDQKTIQLNIEAAIDEELNNFFGDFDKTEEKAMSMSDAFTSIGSSIGTMRGTLEEGTTASYAFAIAQQAAAVASAVATIANQGLGDPYTAFARIAAMTAAMGALLSTIGAGVNGGGGGSGGGRKRASTALGGGTEGSESFSKSLELMEESYSMEVEKLTSIYNELQSMNQNISGLMANLVKMGIGDVVDQVAIRDAMRRETGADVKIRGVGLQFGEGSIADVLGGGIEAQQFIQWRNSKLGTDTGDLSTGANAQLQSIFNSIGTTFVSLTEQFGQDAATTLAYVFPEIALNFKKMTSEEIQDELVRFFSETADIATEALFAWTAEYQQMGEGLYETAIRLATDMAVVSELTKKIGLGFGGMGAQDIIAITESLVSFAGGLDELSDAVNTYYDKFFTEAEKQINLERDLKEQFALLNMELPDSREGFREVVDGLDLTTEAGQEAFVSLMKMSEYSDDYYSSAEAAAEKVADIMADAADMEVSLQDRLNQLTMSDEDYNRLSINTEYAAMIDAINEMSEESGQDMSDLIALTETVRDAELKQLDIQQQAYELDFRSIADMEKKYTQMFYDTTSEQQAATSAQEWLLGVIEQLDDMGIQLFNTMTYTMTAGQQAFRDKLNTIYTRQIMDLRDSVIKSQEELVDVWRDAAQKVRDQLYQLSIESTNPEDAVARLALVKDNISDITGMDAAAYIASFGTAQEQAAAVGELADMWMDYLAAAQDIYQRPSAEYQDIYGEVRAQLEQLEGIAVGYQTQEEILLNQVNLLTEIRDILDFIGHNAIYMYDDEFIMSNVPGYAEGTGISGKPGDGLAFIHDEEIVLNKQDSDLLRSGGSIGGNDVYISVTVNESQRPMQTGKEVSDAVIGVMRSDTGRRVIQDTSTGL